MDTETLEKRLRTLELLISDSVTSPTIKQPKLDPKQTIVGEIEQLLSRFQKITVEDSITQFLHDYEEMKDILELKNVMISPEDARLIVLSSLNELETNINMLKELEEYLPVLEKDFEISESKKELLSEIELNDPSQDIQANHDNLIKIISESRSFYNSVSEKFVRHHDALESITRVSNSL